LLENAHVRGGSPDIHNQGVAHTGQEGGAPQGVGGSGGDREHRVFAGVIDGHQGAVVLGDEQVRLHTVIPQHVLKRPVSPIGDAGNRCIQDGGVFPFQDADAADLAG
jgi:hypothetical protein